MSDILLHIGLFFASAFAIWIFSGFIIDAVDRVAKRFHQSGFTIAFFLLGFMKSSYYQIYVLLTAWQRYLKHNLIEYSIFFDTMKVHFHTTIFANE